jgi:hypothetical protein
MTQRSLFTPDPSPFANSEQAEPCKLKIETSHKLNIESSTALRPDVLRVIEHAKGPFRRVRECVVVAEYRIVELHDGRFFEETTDGRRSRCDHKREFIEHSIREGFWIEKVAE